MATVISVNSIADLKPGPVCAVCPIYHRCRMICEPVESLLPSMDRARVDPEDLPHLIAGMRLTNALLDNMHLLTPHQQEVVRLYYRESLRQQEIAALLEVSQQAINDSLHRARVTVGGAFKATRHGAPNGGDGELFAENGGLEH